MKRAFVSRGSDHKVHVCITWHAWDCGVSPRFASLPRARRSSVHGACNSPLSQAIRVSNILDSNKQNIRVEGLLALQSRENLEIFLGLLSELEEQHGRPTSIGVLAFRLSGSRLVVVCRKPCGKRFLR